MRQPLTGNPLFRLVARAGAVANAVPAPLNGEQSLASGAMSSAGPLIVRIQLLPHLGSEPAAIELARHTLAPSVSIEPNGDGKSYDVSVKLCRG